MSRDSRLVHTQLFALAEHLKTHNDAIAAAAGELHTTLAEKRAGELPDTHRAPVHELQFKPDAPLGD